MYRTRSASRSVVALAFLALFATTADAQIKLDPKLPAYKPARAVSGKIKSIGSDSMNNLMTYWQEGFKKHYPGVTFEIEGKGSGTAPPALIEGTATFGPMSRDMKESEVAKFKEKYGYEPTELRTAIDALAVFVHKDNPVDSLTLPQIDAIFSQTRRLGHEPIVRWGQTGAGGPLGDLPISLYGRSASSGTYGFFKEKALADGDFSGSVKEQPGSAAVVQGVAGDTAGVGYSGIGYKTSGVKAVAVAKDGESDPIEPTAENVYKQKYPLFRFLNLYVNAKPGQKLDPLRAEFIKFVFSREGQEAVVKDGYFPIPATLAAKELEKIGVKP